MYNKKIGFVFAMVVAGVIFIGCGSTDEKFESAQDKLQDNSVDLNSIIENQANKIEQKIAIAKEWIQFKSESEARIKIVDSTILELKRKIQKTGMKFDSFYSKQILSFEVQTKKLQAKIDDYNKNHSMYEDFKQGFNHDMEFLTTALKDFTKTIN